MADAGRGDGRRVAPAGVGQREKTARRGAAGGGPAARDVRHPAPGSGSRPYRTVLHGIRSDPGPVRLSRFPQEFARAVQAHPRRDRAPAHRARASCNRPRRNRNGATPQSAPGSGWDPVRPLTELGDWLDRVVWQRRPAAAGVGRVARHSSGFAPATDGAASLKSMPLRQTGPAARAGRRLAQGHPPRRVGIAHRPRPAQPCSRKSSKRLKPLVERALGAGRDARGVTRG